MPDKGKGNGRGHGNGRNNSANNADAPCDDSINQSDVLSNLTMIIQTQHTGLAAANASLYQALKETFAKSEAFAHAEIFKLQ